MTVKIITDSVADLPESIVADLDISVAPLIVRFGSESYRDGVDLGPNKFYQKLRENKTFPVTSVPPPSTYFELYHKLEKETDEILVITLSSNLSGTNQVAHQARALAKTRSRIEIIDSRLGSIAEGLVVIKAARAAKKGAKLDDIIHLSEETIPRVEVRATFDTLEYLRRGGRIGAAQAFLGSLLKINPIIALKNGLVEPVERTRSRSKAITHLFNFVSEFKSIEELAVGDGDSPSDAKVLSDRLATIFSKKKLLRTRMTPVIGAHTGPGLLLVAVMGDR